MHELLKTLGYAPDGEHITESGEADIYMPQNMAVVETKRPGRVGPDLPGSSTGETQAEQLARYVENLVRRERDLPLDDASMVLEDQVRPNWTGILTDGRMYFVYRFDSVDGSPLGSGPIERRSFAHNAPIQLVRRLRVWLGEDVDLLALPDDKDELAGIFGGLQSGFLEGLEELYVDLSDTPGTKTKRSLWERTMNGSGFDVGESKDRLFRDHTLLVNGAEAVVAAIMGDTQTGTDIMADGFATWATNRDSKGNPGWADGVEWTDGLFDSVRDYDWRSRGRDVLRDVYEVIIPSRHRKAFGEYYTPNWLTAAVVHEVLDDDWCENAIAAAYESIHQRTPLKGRGVLDPACGSGTFLYQAARRILESKAMDDAGLRSVEEEARVVLRLVNGIDVHPVAVSLARATLLSALPPAVRVDPDEVNVYLADSLGVERLGGIKEVTDEKSGEVVRLEARSPGGIPIPIPLGLADAENAGHRVKRIVESAHLRRPLPTGVDLDLSASDAEHAAAMHGALTQVCNQEGNSVWSWWLNNWLAARALRRRKVDRITTNPPWVELNEIQVESRRLEIESLLETQGITGKGKNRSSFDIAGLFVKRCREMYLTADGSAAGWVLPWSALKSQTWQRTRDQQQQFISARWDLSEVKDQPFASAKACVWIQSGSVNGGLLTKVLHNFKGGDSRLASSDSLDAMNRKTYWEEHMPRFSKTESDYVGRFHRGADFNPHCLVLVKAVGKSSRPGYVKVTLTGSKRMPWKKLKPPTVEVLEDRVREAVFAKHDLLPFCLQHGERSRVIIVPKEVSLAPDRPEIERLEKMWSDHRGKGKPTPITLAENIDDRGKLTRQTRIGPAATGCKVVYNLAGKTLRAARVQHDLLIDKTCYWIEVSTQEEAAYLTTVLNAPALQLAFDEARTNDRTFDLTPENNVPIPAFDPKNDLHQQIADLATVAETKAQEAASWLRDSPWQQTKKSKEVRRFLRQEGVDTKIDEAVRALMPRHTVKRYDEHDEHPWAWD